MGQEFPNSDTKVLPLVFLAELSEPGRTTLVRILREILRRTYDGHRMSTYEDLQKFKYEFEMWSPSHRLLNSITKESDKWSVLHALAVLAYRCGRPDIIVIDKLAAENTQLSVSHTDKDHEDEDYLFIPIPVIVITTRQHPSSPRSLSVFARRTVSDEHGSFQYNIPVLSHNDDPYGRDSVHHSPYALLWDRIYGSPYGPLWEHNFIEDIPREKGMMLHDIDRPPFENTEVVLGWEKYLAAVNASLCGRLPPELVHMVISDIRTAPGRAQLWKRRPSRTNLIILLCYSASAKEVEETQAAVSRVLPTLYPNRVNESVDYDMELRLMFDEDVPFKFTAEVIPLEQHRCRSRRDFAAFWETCNVWDPQFGVDLSNTPTLPLLLLPRPTEDIEGECFSAITHFGSRGNLAFVAELSLHSICRSMTDLGRVVVSKPGRRPSSRYPPFIDLKEGVQKPRETIWYPILQINHCEPGALEVFSLANKLTEEEKHWLRDEIVSTSLSYLEDAYLARSNPEGERFYVIAARNIDFLFKPWDEVNEIRGTGTIMDIWNVVFKSAMTDYPPPEAQIWIDPQSALDSTVIMVKPDYYGGPVEHELLNDIQCPRLRGFSYLRLPAKMIRCCFMTERRPSLDWGPLKDMKLELKAFRRPGWPAEGLLVDDP